MELFERFSRAKEEQEREQVRETQFKQGREKNIERKRV
jgi:hypothetical protein